MEHEVFPWKLFLSSWSTWLNNFESLFIVHEKVYILEMIGSLFFCSHDLTEIIVSIMNKCCPYLPQNGPILCMGRHAKDYSYN